MFVTVQKSVLAEALAKAARMVAKGDTIPILNCIKFTATDEGIRLVGGNTAHTIEVHIPADNDSVIIEKTGSIVLPALLREIVRKLEQEDVTIQTNGDLITTIKSGEATFQLNGIDPEEYPSQTLKNAGRGAFTLTGEKLKDFVAKTAHSASKSGTRPVLEGVFVQTGEGKLKFTATDSHRLSLIERLEKTKEPLEAIVHRDSFVELVRVVDEQDEVEITLADNWLVAETKGMIFRSRLLEGNYPNVDRVIPQDYTTKVGLNRSELLSALDRLSILTSNKVVKMSVKEIDISHVVELETAEAEKGSAQEMLFVEGFEGELLEISFNAGYAIEALKALEDTDVIFGFTGEHSPFTVMPKNEAGELQLILPVRAS